MPCQPSSPLPNDLQNCPKANARAADNNVTGSSAEGGLAHDVAGRPND